MTLNEENRRVVALKIKFYTDTCLPEDRYRVLSLNHWPDQISLMCRYFEGHYPGIWESVEYVCIDLKTNKIHAENRSFRVIAALALIGKTNLIP